MRFTGRLVLFSYFLGFGCMALAQVELHHGDDEPCFLEPLQYLSLLGDYEIEGIDNTGTWRLDNYKEAAEIARNNPGKMDLIPAVMYQIREYYDRTYWSPREMEIIGAVNQVFAFTQAKPGLLHEPKNQDGACSDLHSLEIIFHRLCSDDRYFLHMAADGTDPQFGKDEKPFSEVESYPLDKLNARLVLGEQDGTHTLALFNDAGSVVWSKLLTSNDLPLQHVRLSSDPIIQSSDFGFVIGLMAGQRPLKLYLRSDGSFRGYVIAP